MMKAVEVLAAAQVCLPPAASGPCFDLSSLPGVILASMLVVGLISLVVAVARGLIQYRQGLELQKAVLSPPNVWLFILTAALWSGMLLLGWVFRGSAVSPQI
jgi:hypothetical protein